MGMSIQHNMLMMNANRQFNTNTTKKAKTAERLSSGYRINRAADDAAGLAISEKMRWMIRGLNQGTANARDGVSWVQIGDGSLEETHAILHRMTELAIKSANGTYTDEDRAMLEVEFDHLQKEVDRLTDATRFNEQHIFQEHEDTYYQIEGATQWPHEMFHTVRNGDNDLVVTYRQKESDAPETATITVPPGKYTTRELMDEIDTALADAGYTDEGIVFEYTRTGTCNLNLEGGEKIDEVSGGLSYLLFDNYGGGTLGALIGTTVFENNDTATLLVQDNTNDYLTFKVISADDSAPPKDIVIDLDAGTYTKNQFLTILNQKLQAAGTNVEATEHGTGIQLSSPDYIISEFKGNMFEIDGALYTSIFYDNIQHANISYTSAVFQGGYVLQNPDYYPAGNGNDPENTVFHFTKGVNDLLVLKPNEGNEITIDLSSMDGHTMADTCGYLNNEFQRLGVDLTAKPIASPSVTYVTDMNGNRKPVQYVSMEIDSGVEGLKSKVGIDKAKSTAYNTLFTAQNYTTYANDAVFGGNDTVAESNAYLEGLRNLNGGLEIKAGVNDSFQFQTASDSPVTVTLDAKTYNNAADLAAEIKDKLDAAGYGASKISVTANAGHIRIEGATPNVKGIKVSSVPGNEGYRDIFQDETLEPKNKSLSGVNAKITLPEKAVVGADGKVHIDPAYGNLMVRLDGTTWKSVTVGGDWDSLDALAAEITEKLKPTEKDNGFTSVNPTGTSNTTSAVTSTTKVGQTLTNAKAADYTATGKTVTSGAGEGSTGGLKENSGAKVTFKAALPDTIEITDKNKNFNFTLNGQKYNMDLSKDLPNTKFTSPEAFRAALQTAINKKLNKNPDQLGGIKVDLGSDGKTLSLTAGLKNGNVDSLGINTNLTLDTNTAGGFIFDLHDASTAHIVSLGARENGYTTKAMNEFTPDKDVTLKLTLSKPGAADTNVTVTLKKGTKYDQTTLQNAFDTQLKNKGITAKCSGTGVVFETVGKGNGNSVTVDTSSDAIKYMFGYKVGNSYSLTDNHAAEATIGTKVQSNVTLAKGSTGNGLNFKIKVDGTEYIAKLTAKTYAKPEDIAAEIKKQVNAVAGKTVLSDVSIDSYGRLYFKTQSKNGANSSIELSYDSDSAMKQIFGTTPVAGAKASFSTDGQLTLERTGGPQTGGSIYVTSDLVDNNGYSTSYRGGSFIFSDKKYSDPKPYDGHQSTVYSYMDGVDLEFNANGKIDINDWNNELSFWFTEHYGETGNTPQQIKVSQADLPPKNDGYTMEELKNALQSAINKQTGGQQKLNVTVTEKGVRIESAKAGKKYRIYTNKDAAAYRPSGSFYEKVLCSGGRNIRKVTEIQDKDGKQTGDEVFAVGRQDVRNNTVRIQKDGNDTLSLEFSVPGRTNPYKLEMLLDAGYYNGNELVKQIQKKLNEALAKEGLPEGLIEVGIGTVATNIVGSNDRNALAFKLSEHVPAPEKGRYGIEAIGGTAAFSVFYATEGDIAKAYIKGGKDISNGIDIREDATDFSVEVDGTEYNINLTPGHYTSEQLTEHISTLLKDENCPLRAMEDEGVLKLMHTKYGQHKISNLSGAIKNQLFFKEHGRKRDKEPLNIRLSSVDGDRVSLERPRINTVTLGINTVLISKPKYIEKAIDRIKEAVVKVSKVRTYFGAMQNRLESIIRNNENKAENTTASESRIRDADFAKEVVKNSINSILEQAGTSVMAQARQNAQLALQLLS